MTRREATSAIPPATREKIHRVTTLIQEEVGRNIEPLLAATRNGVAAAAQSLLAANDLRIGVLSGFFVPRGRPPAAETDGPPGAALFLAACRARGKPYRFVTDAPCAPACRVALRAAGVEQPIDVVADADALSAVRRAWTAAGISHVLAIERCGQGPDGRLRNMKGEDITAHTLAFDRFFADGPWSTLAVGDGGNEIGMGQLDRSVIAGSVAFGTDIACVTPADHLVVAGVSNWGVYGLLTALALLDARWCTAVMSVLTEEKNQAVISDMVRLGPAVDGVTGNREVSVDGLPLQRHNDKIRALRALL